MAASGAPEPPSSPCCAAAIGFRCAIVWVMAGDLSLNEWVVLALLAEGPSHGFALSKELAPDADLGRVLTVARPLVYRALDRVVGTGLAEPVQVEPGDAGPNRTVHRLTRRGRARLRWWFVQPVDHVRDLRIEFLVKVRLLERASKDTAPLIAAQRDALAEPFERLTRLDDEADVVDLWRHHNAVAAQSFLDRLA